MVSLLLGGYESAPGNLLLEPATIDRSASPAGPTFADYVDDVDVLGSSTNGALHCLAADGPATYRQCSVADARCLQRLTPLAVGRSLHPSPCVVNSNADRHDESHCDAADLLVRRTDDGYR